MDRSRLERMLGEGMSLAAIGRELGRHESTVAYWVAKHGLSAGGSKRFAARGGLGREDLAALVAKGLSIAQIASEVDRSKATVRHWLLRYKLQTSGQVGRGGEQSTGAARAAGKEIIIRTCTTHGSTEFLLEGRGYYRCRRCRAQRVSERRRKVKAILITEAGGCCRLCGYDRCPAALHFHHVHPATKSFHLSMQGVGRSIAAARAEMAKCILLCANCHAEVEQGLVRLS
jgi:transposase